MTVSISSPTRSPEVATGPPVALSERRDGDRGTLRLIQFALVFGLLLQRLGLPVGGAQVPVVLPVVLVVMVLLGRRGDLVQHHGRTAGYLVAMGCCTLSALVAFVRGLPDASVTSLFLLIVVYAPFCYALQGDRTHLYTRVLDTFLAVATGLAIVAVLQFGAQLAGWTYHDLFADVVPQQLIMQGFNTSYPIKYGATLYKSNAFLYLEPSFCSQFTALALIGVLVRGTKRWRIPILLLALFTTVSGTGLLLLAAGLGVLAWRRGPRFAMKAAAIAAVAIFLVSLTPVGAVYKSRATETSDSESSGSLRFVQPYTRTFDRLAQDPLTVFTGAGPGWADRDAAAFELRTGLPLNYGLLPKLVLEYGIISAIAFLAFVIPAFTRGGRSPTLGVCILVLYTLLSSTLLGPVVVYFALILTALFSEPTVPLPAAPLSGEPVSGKLTAGAAG